MNNEENTENQNPPERHTGRPLGYWLRLVDGLLTRELGLALASEGVSRRDWMLLNVLAGTVDAPGLDERLARKGKRLRRLEHLGWALEQGDGTWVLTDAGREAHARLADAVSGVRSRVTDAVSSEDYATTLAALEAMARELGWDESQPFPRGGGLGGGRFRGSPFGGPPFGGPPFAGAPRPEIRHGWGPSRHHGFEPGRAERPGAAPRHGTAHDDAWRSSGLDDPECPDHGHHPGAGRGRDAHGNLGHGLGHLGHGLRHGHGHGGHGHEGHGHGHGHEGHGHGHGHEGHGHESHGHGNLGHGHGNLGHGHGGHGHEGRGRHDHRGQGRRKAERAYERGFAAGFRAAQSTDARRAEASDPAA
ncbi:MULTISPECIES: hypothetical protein [Microbacterium]|uniref:hypothetical protein n=1 Tax=Microbacterium TaxID=33882 RepID=UPI00146D90F5|nr:MULTISPECIES: hypothetical protein [Microbacterium]